MSRSLGDDALVLADGRTVGYCLYGDPDGYPVVNCHGGLVSGHDVGPAADDAAELGLCLVSPDRPGIGRTDRLAGLGMLRWVASDLVPLLDHLSVGRFAVMGWSEGGQYALATAHALGARTTRCAVVAGCPPLDDPRMLAELNGIDRSLTALVRRAPFLAEASFRLIGLLARYAPAALGRAATRGLPGPEVEAVRTRGRWLPTLLGEGAADPKGGVDQYRAFVAPWGFAPEEVAVAVRVFQGTDDHLVPASWGRILAGRIPGASLTCYPGEGHFIALTRRRAVLQYLAG